MMNKTGTQSQNISIRKHFKAPPAGWVLIALPVLFFWTGCEMPTSYETAISLLAPVTENTDPNARAPKPVDPLDVLIATEKIAAKAGLKPYSTADDEASLLDIADSDLSDDTDADIMNVTEWKHPDLPVYLTITRKSEEILILLNCLPDASGQLDADTARLYKTMTKQLSESLAGYGMQIR